MFAMCLLLILVLSVACLFVVPLEEERLPIGATIVRDEFGRVISSEDANGRAILNEVFYSSDEDTVPSLITALSCIHFVRVPGNRYIRVYLDGISRREVTDLHLDQESGDFRWTGVFINVDTLDLYRQQTIVGVDRIKKIRLPMEGELCSKKKSVSVVTNAFQPKQSSSWAMSNTKTRTSSPDIKLAS
jgi:hypothetical protein